MDGSGTVGGTGVTGPIGHSLSHTPSTWLMLMLYCNHIIVIEGLVSSRGGCG